MACWDRGHLCVPPGMGDSASRRAAARGIAPALHAWGGAGLGKGGTGLSAGWGALPSPPSLFSSKAAHPQLLMLGQVQEGFGACGGQCPPAAWMQGVPNSRNSSRSGALPGASIPLQAQFVPRQCGELTQKPLPLHPQLCCAQSPPTAGWALAPAWMLWLHAKLGQG